MTPEQFWKNFNMLDEVGISGAFIYNGLRRFHEMQVLEHTDELFEFLYYLSVGLERLLKVAVVLLEHDDSIDIEKFEQSLITHTHEDLLRRVRQHADLKLSGIHNEFLTLLGTFYKRFRYNRFLASSAHSRDKEKEAILAFLSKHLDVEFDTSSMLAVQNEARFKRFVSKVVVKISSTLYSIVRDAAGAQGLYTYEIRHESRAETVFLGGPDLPGEDVAWKELIVYLMNTKDENGILKHMRSIEPLEFEPADLQDYLECFGTAKMNSWVSDLVETRYDDIEGEEKANRLGMLSLIANPGVYFPIDEDEEDDFEFESDKDESET